MFNTELTTYKTGGGTLSDKSMHPGEYGRASAWIKKIKNDLVLNKDIYGHPPVHRVRQTGDSVYEGN
jgi:hypothetical protein